jgi:tetratricopeptide (TPR) repeat protein
MKKLPSSIAILFLLCSIFAILSHAEESVFFNKDTITILSQGGSTLGTGIYADEKNPFALFAARNDGVEKAAAYLSADPKALGFAAKQSEISCAIAYSLASEVLQANRKAFAQSLSTHAQIMSKATLKALAALIKKARTPVSRQNNLRLLTVRSAGLIAAFDTWPNTKENCQTMVNSLAATEAAFKGILDDNRALQIQLFTNAISYDPNFALAYGLRGQAFSGQKQSDKALADYTKALALDSFASDLYYLRGCLYKDMKQDSAAMDDFARAALHDTINAAAFYSLGILLKQAGIFNDAIMAFSRVIEIDSAYPGIFPVRAKSYDTLKQYSNAIVDYGIAIRRNPNDEQSYFNRGIDHRMLGAGYEKQAEFDFTRVISINPKNTAALFHRGMSYFSLGRHVSAVADFTAAIANGLNSADVFYYRGCSLASQKKNTEAMEDFSRAIDLKIDYTDAYYNRGYSAGALGKWDQAITDLTQTITLNPQYAKAYFNRGWAYKALKKNDEATADLSRYLELAGNADGMENKVKQMLSELKYDFDIGRPSPEKVIQDQLEREKRKKKD